MINPKEAAEDNHVLKVAALIFVLSIVGILLFFTHDSGLKYWLLKGIGVPTQGTVAVYYAPTPDRSRREFLKNSEAFVGRTSVEIDYRDNAGNQKQLRFVRPVRPNAGPILETYTVLYLPLNSSIAYPEAYLDDFRVDAHISLWSLVIGLAAALMLGRSMRSWNAFRSGMRRY